MIKDEKGFVLSLMLGIMLIVATILLSLTFEIQTRAASYERTQSYLMLDVLEQMALDKIEGFLTTTAIELPINETFEPRTDAFIMISIEKDANFFDFHYEIRYNGFIRERSHTLMR